MTLPQKQKQKWFVLPYEINNISDNTITAFLSNAQPLSKDIDDIVIDDKIIL